MDKNFNIGFIGAGNMARAIAGGLTAAKEFSGVKIAVSDSGRDALEGFTVPDALKTADNTELVRFADIIILAVKPVHAPAVMAEIASVSGGKIIVSVMAGITLDTLAAGISSASKFVRVMPNLASKAGMSMSAVAVRGLTAEEQALIVKIFDTVGITSLQDEALFDIITAVSGSGPAYFYLFIDAIIKAAVVRGMSDEDARLFAAQTAKGAAECVLLSHEPLDAMIDAVCSKGGTTIEAVNSFRSGGLEAAVDKAVDAAYRRSKELDKNR